ncbi:MAG: protein-glutamate O-methyltransferase CheR [Candidatus Acidiferrales bacterium]
MKEKASANSRVTERELDEIRVLIEQRSGIQFDESRERFFSTRVIEHLRERGFADSTAMFRRIASSNSEYDALLERLLTQETSFFRYPAVYQALVRRILTELQAKKFWEKDRTLRIWSAGCSTGEEPYSIAIAIADALEFADAWNVEILATDISQRALKHAERGVYGRRALENLTPDQIKTHFAADGTHFKVRPRLRRWITFSPMNLAQAVYVGRMDCIFCMNVLIYFSDEQRHWVLQRFYDALEPGGYLFLGHSESIANKSLKLESIQHGDCIVYRKPGAAVPAHALAGAKS